MKKIVILLVFGLLTGSTVFAQKALKLGWINSADLLQAMPDKVKADSAIAKYTRSFQDEIDIMMKQYQTDGQYYQNHEKTMSDAMKQVKLQELQDLQSRIESTKQSAQDKIQQKNQEVYAPVLDKADKAIKEVAEEKGYDYIFDKSAGSLLVAPKGDNILPYVKAKLGIK